MMQLVALFGSTKCKQILGSKKLGSVVYHLPLLRLFVRILRFRVHSALSEKVVLHKVCNTSPAQTDSRELLDCDFLLKCLEFTPFLRIPYTAAQALSYQFQVMLPLSRIWIVPLLK